MLTRLSDACDQCTARASESVGALNVCGISVSFVCYLVRKKRKQIRNGSKREEGRRKRRRRKREKRRRRKQFDKSTGIIKTIPVQPRDYWGLVADALLWSYARTHNKHNASC